MKYDKETCNKFVADMEAAGFAVGEGGVALVGDLFYRAMLLLTTEPRSCDAILSGVRAFGY